jgi:hypothetical protein
MPWFSKRPLSLGLPHQTLYALIYSSICVTCSVSLILPDLFTQLTFGEVYMLRRFSLCNSIQSVSHTQ